MSDAELKSKQKGAPTDPGRARQRKLKRAGQALQSNNAMPPSRQRRAARQSLRDLGESARERLAQEKANLPKVSLPHIPDEISLKKISDVKKLARRQAEKSTEHVVEKVARTTRRKGPSRSENLYESSSHTETQRRSDTRPAYPTRVSRRTFESKSDAAPPVMVRGGLGGMAFGRFATSKLNKHKTPKRRIDVPLSVPGAELRLPSIPLLQIGWRAVSLLMVIMMIASLILVWKAPTFKIASMKAEGLQRLTLSDLNAVIRITGKSIFSINPTKVDKALEQAFPELSKISVKVSLPATVQVIADERQPVIDWIQDNRETWVDAEGVSFPARGTISDTLVKVEGYGTPPGLIQVPVDPTLISTGVMTTTNFITSSLRLSPDLVSAILALGAKMPPDTLLVYDSEHGLGWNDPKGWDVFFGTDEQEMDMKLAVYQSLVERLESQGIQPALISVEYVHAPYYRMER